MAAPDRFSCEQVFARLADYLDRELSADERRVVDAHLSTCAACAREYRFETHLIDDVRAKLGRIAVPETLRSRLGALLGATPPAPPPPKER